jgi:hypothetical protein
MRAKHLAALLGFVLVQDLTGPSLGPALGLGARAQNPTVKVTRFENLPRNLFYFDDTAVSSVYYSYPRRLTSSCCCQTVLYHDSVEGNVYVSEDEGKSWNQAAGVPPNHALMLIEHPFENRMVSPAHSDSDSGSGSGAICETDDFGRAGVYFGREDDTLADDESGQDVAVV